MKMEAPFPCLWICWDDRLALSVILDALVRFFVMYIEAFSKEVYLNNLSNLLKSLER